MLDWAEEDLHDPLAQTASSLDTLFAGCAFLKETLHMHVLSKLPSIHLLLSAEPVHDDGFLPPVLDMALLPICCLLDGCLLNKEVLPRKSISELLKALLSERYTVGFSDFSGTMLCLLWRSALQPLASICCTSSSGSLSL